MTEGGLVLLLGITLAAGFLSLLAEIDYRRHRRRTRKP